MKVAELYAELGIKVTDPQAIKDFEASLTNMAATVKDLVASLNALAKLKMPRVPGASSTRTTPVTPGSGGAKGGSGYGAFNSMMAGGPPTPSNPAFIGPLQPQGASGAPNTAVNQSLKSLGTFAKQLVGIGSLAYVIKQLATGLKDLTLKAAKTSFATDKFGKATGLSREELLRWQTAAAKADVTPDAMRETMSGLAQQAYEIQFGQHREAATLLAGWGLDLQASADKILEQFGQKMGARNLTEALMVARYAGIDPSVAYMMHANKGVIPKFEPGMALDEKQQANTLALGKSVGTMSVAITALGNKLVSELAPAIMTFIDAMTSLAQLASTREGRFGLVAAGLPTMFMGSALPFTTPASKSPTTGTSTYTNTNNILIEGAREPQSIAREVSNASKQSPQTGP